MAKPGSLKTVVLPAWLCQGTFLKENLMVLLCLAALKNFDVAHMNGGAWSEATDKRFAQRISFVVHPLPAHSGKS